MKTKKKLAAILLALAACVAAPARAADIYEIRAVDFGGMVYNKDRNPSDPSLCSASHPLVAGDRFYIRVRMAVRNAADCRAPGFTPQTWSFKKGSGSGGLPKLGIFIGDTPTYATYDADITAANADTIDDDALSIDCNWYNDFYFAYDVQPGDLGLPVVLMDSDKKRYSVNDNSKAYFLLNCGENLSDSAWVLSDTGGNVAEFRYGSTSWGIEPPETISGDDSRWFGYSLESEGIYVKTVDFDDDYASGDIWRYAYAGRSTPVDVLLEPMVEIPNGGVAAADTTVWVFSEDESIVAPDGATQSITYIDGSGVEQTRNALPVTIKAGASSATFKLRGADSAAEGAWTNICMSATRTPTYNPMGMDTEQASIVRRKVMVRIPPPPTVSMRLDGKMEVECTADADYETAKVLMTFTIDQAVSAPVTLDLAATYAGGGGSISGMYDYNFIRLCDTATFNDTKGRTVPTQATIPAGETSVTKYVFILGASNFGSASDTEDGIEFLPSIASAPADVRLADDGPCTLYIYRGGDMNPVAVIGKNPDVSVVNKDPGNWQFKIKVADTYRSMNAKNNSAGYSGYTIYVEDADDGTTLLETSGKKPDKNGWLTLSLPVDKSLDGRDIVIYALSPDGETYTDYVYYTLDVNDAQQVTVAPQEEGVVFVGESDTEMFPLTLSINKAPNEVKYIFLQGATAADDQLFTSPQKTTGAAVGPTASQLSAPGAATFSDGRSGGTPVTMNAFLSDSQTDPTQVITAWTPGTLTVTVTNKPPEFLSLTFNGDPLTPADNGKTLDDPVSLNVENSFVLSVKDVAADLGATGADAFKVKWVFDNGTPEEKEGDPNGVEVKHAFTAAKTASVSVWLKDKDMPNYPTEAAFTFYVKVREKPAVTITTGADATGGTFLETDANKDNAWVKVELEEKPTEAITVRFTVGQTTDGGFLKLRTVAGSVEQAVDGGGNPIPGAYDIAFAAGQAVKQVVINDMDGSVDSAAGLALNASVITESLNPYGIRWCDYYAIADEVEVKVQNVEPVLNSVTFDGQYIKVSEGAPALDPIVIGVPKKLSLSATDVDADINATEDGKKFQVKWSIDGVVQEKEGNPEGVEVTHTFTGPSGRNAEVRVWLKDKDMTGYPTDPAFTFQVPLKDRPFVAIAPSVGDSGTLDENASGAYFDLTLSESAAEEIKVRFTVGQTTDGGFLKLRTVAGSVEQAVDDLGNEIPGAYDITFVAGQTQRRPMVASMDGTADTAGGLVFNASVITDTVNPQGVKWSDYYAAANPVTVYVQNVEPVMVSLSFNGDYFTPADYGATSSVAVARGVAKTFSVTAGDVDADLNAAAPKDFKIKWEIDGATYYGATVSHTFTAEKEAAVVRVFMKDKDSTLGADEWGLPKFMFKVPVKDRPKVEITLGNDGTYVETDDSSDQAYVAVELSEPATVEITARLTVAQADDGGFMKLRTQSGSVEQAVDGEGNPIPGAYDLTFAIGETRKVVWVARDGFDGTADTRAGLDVNAWVTTTSEYAPGIPWSDYYTPAGVKVARVVNVPPEIVRPTEEEAAYTNENASANTPYSIYYGCTDVKADLEAGVVAEINVDGLTSLPPTPVTDASVREHRVEFSGPGTHFVEVKFTDKDNMTSRRTIYFFVQPSKNIDLSAHGPASAVASDSGDSMRYEAAKGLGAGRVYAGEYGPQKVKGFIHSYSVSREETTIDAVAFGYKADGRADDGTLGGDDVGIDKDGNWTKGTPIAEYYNYSTDTEYAEYGALGFDSFPYAWACNNVSASTSGDSKKLLFNIGTKSGAAARMAIPLPTSSVTSEGSGSNIPTYPKQYWEAVFSRELFTADNCGDINQDGIPDIVVFSFGMGIFAEGNLASDVGSEKDLKYLGDYNGDLDKDENESPDFLPAEKTSIYGSLIPGLSGTWVTEGDEFTARLEIRGYDDGLNGALDKPSDGRSSTYWPTSFGIKSDRIYAEEVDGKWQWTENCTISKVEWYAWTEYAAANGLDPDNSDNWSKWSPERPTSPIKSDTDGDGFDDGYEYFFWYRAYVGYMEDGIHKRLTGRRFNVKNPGEGELITSETIAALMDPLVPADASAKTRDTDNDGLPDLLEFMIGTNPFDFDTDGDGLPDGWELMVAGLNPLLPVTSADGIADGTRNYDGDAMAITSYALEQAEHPAPWNPERCQYTTLAVVKEGGDTDGVQWYATQSPERIEIATNDVQMWHFKLKDGTDVVSASDTKPTVTADGRLAVDLSRSETFLATVTWKEEVDDSDPENPVTTKVIDGIIRGWPIYIPAGTLVDTASIGDEKSDKTKVVVVKKGMTNPKSELPFINAAWIYGKGKADASSGGFAATAKDYGCLAIGRHLALEKDLALCAMPTNGRDVAFLHYQVYQKCGFDPRTAWRAENPLSARWSKLVNGEAVEGRAAAASGGYCAFPARTREYRTYDEFLVHSFFVNNGCDMSGAPISLSASVPQTVRDWYVFTTNPQGPNEPDRIQLDASEEQSAVGWSQYFFGRDDADNGADTDGDGVPDGWELYVMSGYGQIGDGSGSPYVSPLSPFVPDAKKNTTLVDGTNETLNEFMEFEGTDSIAHYAEARSDDNPPYSTTIKHDGEWKWFNKFFPTDPWSVDTDEDLINDDKEGDDFAYGTPADNGLLRCIPGGGLNPCSIDTDGDGLPDPWEKQFKGTTVFPGSLPDAIAKLGNKAKDSSDNDIGNYLQGLIDGMDGTVWDALNSPFTAPAASDGVATHVVLNVNGAGANQVVDRDYDHDGLENWQEYIAGTMRCWRYDDPISPWKPIPANLYFRADANGNLVRDEETGELVFEPNLRALNRIYHTYDPFAEATPVIEDMGKFWYLTLEDESSRMYNPALVTDLDNPRGGIAAGTTYFEPLKNVWDPCYVDVTLDTDRNAAYYWLYKNSRTGWWSWQQSISGEPKKYACCSPIDPDSDHDGMDDYYELFHGMNPLLGMSGVLLDNGGPCDLVHDSWSGGAEVSAMSALNNHWYNSSRSKEVNGEFDFYDDIWPGAKPRGNGYDFELYPWLNGMADADPDGDGIPNQTEAMMPKLSAAALHTDPTPLWMTDTSYDNSLVRKFFRMPARFNKMSLPGETFERAKENEDGTITVTTYSFKQYAGWHKSPGGGEPDYFASFTPDCWSLTSAGAANWMVSFEQNEGYDTDHDGLSDEEEKKARFRSATDPQDADSPRRRQAMYFQGPERPSALQTMPRSAEAYPVCAKAYSEDMAFRTFTVECWAMPESLDDSVLVERAVWIGNENPGDLERMRKNFQLAIKGGKWYAKFDPFGTRDDDAVEVRAGFDAAANTWTHLAATYDGETLWLYVNGLQAGYAKSGLLPAHGTEAVAVQLMGSNNPQSYWFDFENSYQAVIIGASAKTEAEGVRNGAALDVTRGLGWNRYARFYKGWIDEVRIWDGARTDAQIRDSMNERFTAEMAAANRQEFFDVWSTGVRRDTKDAEGNEPSMPAELRYHWSFDSVFGAQNENAVAISPLGFHDARALLSRPEGYEIAWWKQVLAGYADTVYCNPAWIVWIPSTVAHLPRFDGTTTDSMFWSKDFMGDSLGSYTFANSAEPFSLWTQFFYNGAMSSLWYQTTPERHFLVNASDASNGSSLGLSFEFTGRHLNRCGDDLLALGGAYARYLDNETGLWDGNGASVSWEITGSDSDGDGLPDWWEEYADENYRPDGMDPAEEIGWDTIVVKDGVEMTAGEAYLLDLLEGKYMGADGIIVEDSDAYSRINADDDKNGIPDWWEAKYDVVGQDIFADNDNDGLSNYAEYLAFADHGVVLDPTMSATDGHIHDYFRQITDDEDPMKGWYVGEAVSDHDFMENWLEDQYDSYYVNRHEYDAAFDRDRDGWSNFAEIRAGTDPTVAAILSIDETELPAYPTPVVEADVSLDTGASVEGTVVFQAWSSPTLQGNPDATWSISASSGETASYKRLLGMNPGTVVNIQLGPGSVVPDSISIDFCDPTAHEYYYNVESNGTRTLRQVLVIGTGPWQDVYKDSSHSDDPSIGDIINLGGDHSLGTINYKTGEMVIDLGAVQETMSLIKSQTASESVEIETVLARSYVRVGWSSKMLSGSAVTHLYLVEPSEGHLREGKNTFVAFLDTDGNGTASAGEPLCVLRDVDIGWSRACGLAFELVSNHPAGPNFVHESSGSPELVRIFRTAINGSTGIGIRRQVFSRRIDFAGRPYLSRADYVRSGEFDLDWRNLISDAMNADIKPADIVSAEYEVYFGTNVLADATFTRTFPVARSAPVVVAPSESSGYLVRTARPVFAWAGSDGYTAFDIQVATTNEQGAYVNVWESGVKSLPAHGALGYEFSPEMYVGRELYDGSNYFWRVAQFNAKYPTDIRLADQDVVWSEWAEFRTAVDSTKLDTGYGRVKVDVRYFGPATDEPLTNVFVEVFSSPDFTGKLLASVRLGDTLGTETKTGSLAVTNDIVVPFLSVCTNNAVVLDGIRVGTVYVRAFVDRNGNGRRDVWETWGYANSVGTVRSAIYAPAALTVTSKTTACAECVVFMEDTDVNQNRVPDSLEDISVLAASASQGGDMSDFDLDGLAASQEDEYGTDSTLWDTDGDGMPDGWEIIFADTDPLTADGDYVVSDDVMAYAITNMTVVTTWDGSDPSSATNRYAVMDENAVVRRGDDASALAALLASTYDYAGRYGLGMAATAEELEGLLVYDVEEDAEVVLVHAQVYEAFGFDPTTAIPPVLSQDGSNYVYGANTKAFTALDKYLVARYREKALGEAGVDEVAMNTNRAWKSFTLKPGDIDCDRDGVADGWELYVGKNPWKFADRTDNDDDDELTLVEEYDSREPFDPRNTYSVYDYMSAAEKLLPGTPKFTDAEARRFRIGEADMEEDDDNDQLTNLQEIQAYYLDKASLEDIDPSKAWSDGATPDYFRKAQSTYLGLLFNGGEFIEPDIRAIMGIDTFAGVGTRDYNDSGWDAWSTARYSILSGEQTNDVSGVVSDELMLLIRYWNVIRPGEFSGTTVGDAVDFFHEVWGDVVRLIDYEGNVVIETTERHDVSGYGTIHHANAAQTTTQIVDFFGGQAKIEEVIAKNKKDMTAADIVTPEPVVDLVVKYAGNGSHNLVLEAYQVNPVYPEYGEQLSAQWTAPVKFDAGVAKVSQLKTPALGSLKQGQTRFVAYIDVDGDGKLSAGDTSGSATCEVGYLGCDLTITLGEANPALPALRLSDSTNSVSTLALVRTAINGKPLYNSAKGVFIVQFPNNAAREALYPGEYDGGGYIGIDQTLSSMENVDEIESVTYEVLRLQADEVANLSITNLNNYIVVTSVETNDETVVVSNVVSQSLNEEVTFRYSLERDVAQSIACAGSTADDFTLTFTVPTDTANTKFWLNMQTDGAAAATLLGGTKGFILDDIRDGVVVLDKYWFKANGVAIPSGLTRFGVVLGNDKFGRPETVSCTMAEVVINEGASFDGRLAVKVEHPTATLDAKLTVAAYEKADLVNPVATTNNVTAGETVEIAGLRPDVKYYVAAWYVNDADDGRGSADRRMPYDTWGYYCTLDVTNRTQVAGSMAFDAVAVKAEITPSATNTVWLQDTDWNANNVTDREENFRAINGDYDYARTVDPTYGFDIEGVDETDIFSDAMDIDVFAYAEVPFFCVVAEVDGAETWFAVTDLDAAALSTVSVGTSLSNLTTLATTYLYDFGKPNAKRLALGTNIVWTGEEKVVSVVAGKELILVHGQVYDYFGFNPNTANGHIDKAAWVNTRAFTSADKEYVTNYLANVLGETDVSAKALPIDYPDADPVANGRGDGVPDGWELYVKHSPWDYDDSRIGVDPVKADVDKDGLDQLHEWDGGNTPTDPWNIDTDGDGVLDRYACQYHLKGGESDDDFDHDGLSNYAEYLITEVFKLAVCDPGNPKTSDGVADAYRKVGDLYLGEIFSDHDRMEDAVEDELGFSRYEYDAHLDQDVNGWDNESEVRAAGRPVPNIELTLTYDGTVFSTSETTSNVALRVEAYSAGLQSPDAVWNVTLTADDVMSGRGTVSLGETFRGYVRQGKNTFVCFVAGDNGLFAPGKPYGFVSDVDVGWSGTKAAVELTKTSAVFARLDLYRAANDSDDRVVLYGTDGGDVAWNRQGISSNDTPVATLTKAEHLRIVPYSVSGTIQDSANSDREFVELVNLVTNRVVAEFDVDSVNKRTLTEADFIRDGKFDIDWDGFRSEILNDSRVVSSVGDVTAVKYRIVLGRDGSIGKESNLDETSDPARAYATLIERRFEPSASRTRPTALSTDEILCGARPTFRWRLDEPAGVAGYAASPARLGCTYTAFQIQVKDSSGTVVYDSGVRRAPPRDAAGTFSWTAPLCAGDLTAKNIVFAPATNWTWRVAMYNAKFKPARESSNGWSDAQAFSTAVGTQQEMNDNGYGQVNVAVRYAGPTKVLDKCAATTQSKGIVRVQAFDTPDFTGDPVAATIVTDVSVITNTMDISNTVSLVGLKMGGTYYVRAFIDSDGNGVKDDWESWGCVNFLGEKNVSNFNSPKGIALDASAVRAPVVGLFIDDADTDHDWMPDAWEYAEAGWTGDWDVVKNQRKASLGGKVAIDTTGFGDANLSTGLSGAPLTVFESGSFAQQLLGIPASTMTFNDIRAAIDASIHPTTVKITAMTLDSAAKQVVLTLDADVALSVAGRLVSQVYGIEPSGEATVTVMVYKKDTLLDAVWKPACDPITNVKIGANQSQVTVPLDPALDLTSGFYQVVVEPTP